MSDITIFFNFFFLYIFYQIQSVQDKMYNPQFFIGSVSQFFLGIFRSEAPLQLTLSVCLSVVLSVHR